MGVDEEIIAKQHYRFHKKLPDSIANSPELQDGLFLYLQAFFDLDAERHAGMALTPIPWLAIRTYCEANDFDDEQTLDCHYLVREIDTAHIKRLNAKRNGDAS